MGVYQLGRSVTKTLLFLTFYRAFASNFDRAFEKKICRAFVSLLQGFRINFDRAFVPLLQDYRDVEAVSVISGQILLTEFVLRLVFYQNYNEKSSRAEGENRKIDA